jgi:hypothetical protein
VAVTLDEKVDLTAHPYAKQIRLLSSKRIRLSKDAPSFIASVVCSMVHELVEFGMNNVLKADLKIIKPQHVLSDGVCGLQFYPLYKNLPVFSDYLKKEADRVVAELTKKDRKKDADRVVAELAKTNGEDNQPPVDAEEEENDSPHAFDHYVKQICHNVMNKKSSDDIKYSTIRISKHIRRFGSDLIVDFINMMCPLLKSQIKVIKVKTVNVDIIRQIVNLIFTIHNVDYSTIDPIFTVKMDTHAAFLKARAAASAVEAARAN